MHKTFESIIPTGRKTQYQNRKSQPFEMGYGHDIKSAIDMQLLIIQAAKWINY